MQHNLGVLQGKSMRTCNYHKALDASSTQYEHGQFLVTEGDLKPILCIAFYKWTPPALWGLKSRRGNAGTWTTIKGKRLEDTAEHLAGT